MMDAVAFRWRTQIEENAKILALHQALPEMNHNELVGWKYPEEVLRRIGVVLLRDKGDHPQIQRRFDLTREVIAEKAGALHEIWSEGESPFSRVLSSIYLGDFVSLYMAYRNGTDPTPVEIIDFLKRTWHLRAFASWSLTSFMTPGLKTPNRSEERDATRDFS